MNITPKKEEISAVVSLLESEEYDSAEQLAGAVIREVYGILCERDGYGVGIGLPSDDVVLPHGPYFNQGDAKRVVKEAEARGLRAFVAPLFGPSRALRDDEEARGKRCQCGHPKELHGSGKITSTGCGVYVQRVKCECNGYRA